MRKRDVILDYTPEAAATSAIVTRMNGRLHMMRSLSNVCDESGSGKYSSLASLTSVSFLRNETEVDEAPNLYTRILHSTNKASDFPHVCKDCVLFRGNGLF